MCSLPAGVASQSDARAAHGIPKSAPAFTKFVARFIEAALPGARATVTSRLQLDVEPPNGSGHTVDLHNLYSACHRAPDACDQEVTIFVADVVYAYKAKDTGPSRASLRIVVRPSGYVAALRVNPKRDRPLAAPLASDYWIIAVDDRPTSVAMLDENDLAGLNLSAKQALNLAAINTRQVLQQSLQEELMKGSCKGILGGDYFASSTVAFPDLWAKGAHRCHDNLLVSIPTTDVVLFVDGSEPGALKELADYSAHIVAKAGKPFSNAIFRWSANGWVPMPLPQEK